jgi:hypothetical protein
MRDRLWGYVTAGSGAPCAVRLAVYRRCKRRLAPTMLTAIASARRILYRVGVGNVDTWRLAAGFLEAQAECSTPRQVTTPGMA